MMGQINSSKSSDSIAECKLEKKQEVAIDYDTISPRFSVYNIEELQGGIEHLNEYGYAVFSNVLNNEQVDLSVNLFWNYLENLEEPYRIQRNNSQTWDKPWPGAPHIGLVNRHGIGQSEFMWFIRGNPNVKKVFSHIWNSDELCVSFDGAGCFRNWHLNKEWKTSGGWYHCDQNPFKKPNRCSIQGLVALTDNNESTGSLVVVPGSHEHFLELPSAAQKKRIWGDYMAVPQQHSIFEKLRPRLVKCKAGDLVVWDSRCVHCNTPAIVDNENNDQLELLRIVAYICMSPISMFAPDMNEYNSLEEFRQLREQCVKNRSTCTHWPLELVGARNTGRDNKISFKLNAYQHSLVIGTRVEHENGTAEIEF